VFEDDENDLVSPGFHSGFASSGQGSGRLAQPARPVELPSNEEFISDHSPPVQKELVSDVISVESFKVSLSDHAGGLSSAHSSPPPPPEIGLGEMQKSKRSDHSTGQKPHRSSASDKSKKPHASAHKEEGLLAVGNESSASPGLSEVKQESAHNDVAAVSSGRSHGSKHSSHGSARKSHSSSDQSKSRKSKHGGSADQLSGVGAKEADQLQMPEHVSSASHKSKHEESLPDVGAKETNQVQMPEHLSSASHKSKHSSSHKLSDIAPKKISSSSSQKSVQSHKSSGKAETKESVRRSPSVSSATMESQPPIPEPKPQPLPSVVLPTTPRPITPDVSAVIASEQALQPTGEEEEEEEVVHPSQNLTLVVESDESAVAVTNAEPPIPKPEELSEVKDDVVEAGNEPEHLSPIEGPKKISDDGLIRANELVGEEAVPVITPEGELVGEKPAVVIVQDPVSHDDEVRPIEELARVPTDDDDDDESDHDAF
jgi:hypothetical protein